MLNLIFCIFSTDYTSANLVKVMTSHGPAACSMVDNKGWLPAHVACSRHCSPDKLKILLAANPGSLFAKTSDGQTLLSLAQSTATNLHPNHKLIAMLKQHIDSSMQSDSDVSVDGVTVDLEQGPVAV